MNGMERIGKFEWIRLDATDSTNAEAKRRLAQGQGVEIPLLISTERQTAGRGQRGNSWEAEDGKNLLFSMLLHPKTVRADAAFEISAWVSVALCKTLERYGAGFSIKWPNDIYWKDKKVAGILIENGLRGMWVDWSIVGIGLNVNQLRFVSDAPNPVSLAQILGHEVCRLQVLPQFVETLSQQQVAEAWNAYRSRLYRREGVWTFQDVAGAFEARIVDVLPTGQLVLQRIDGAQRHYAFQEVKFVM